MRTKKKTKTACSLPRKAQEVFCELEKQVIAEQLALRARLNIDAAQREQEREQR